MSIYIYELVGCSANQRTSQSEEQATLVRDESPISQRVKVSQRLNNKLAAKETWFNSVIEILSVSLSCVGSGA